MKIIKPEAPNILKNAKNKTFLYKNKIMVEKRPKILGFYKGKTKCVYFPGGFCIKIKPEVKIMKPFAQNILKNAKIKTMVKIIKTFSPVLILTPWY